MAGRCAGTPGFGTGDCLANFSIDFADVEFLKSAIARLDRYDIVLGSKYIEIGYDQRPPARRVGGWLLGRFVQWAFRIPASDTHGLMALRRDRVQTLLTRCRFGHEIFRTLNW